MLFALICNNMPASSVSLPLQHEEQSVSGGVERAELGYLEDERVRVLARVDELKSRITELEQQLQESKQEVRKSISSISR